MSIARRLRRAAMQGKRSKDITIKTGGRGHAPIYTSRDYTAIIPPTLKSKGHGEERKG